MTLAGEEELKLSQVEDPLSALQLQLEDLRSFFGSKEGDGSPKASNRKEFSI